MFTPRQPMIKATPSSRSRASKATPRRSSLFSGIPSGRGQNRSKLNTSSHYQSLLQTSHILEETENHIIEAFGTTLPVAITEILTLSERTSDVSVNLSPNGWAWLVNGRRLVVWRYSKNTASSKQSFNANCRELTLPPSDLAHNAKLVNVFASNENQTPSCIAVSPEGTVRYWPSIAHVGSSFEVTSDLQGQECCSLTDLQPLGSVLTTTTATVVLIYYGNNGGHHSIACRILKPPQGILGGIGRRVSTLLWGGISSGGVNVEAKLVQVLGNSVTNANGMDDPFEKFVFILTSNSLQKWLLAQGEPDKMFYSCDLETMAKQAFTTHLWPNETPADPSWTKTWLLDMQLAGDEGVAILMAGHNHHISQQLHFAIGFVNTATNTSPVEFSSFKILKHKTSFPDGQDGERQISSVSGLDYKLLLPASSNFNVLFMFNNTSVLCFNNEDVEHLDFGSGGNAILGSGYTSEGLAVYFSVTHGLISIQPANQPALDRSNLTFSDNITAEKASRISESLNLSVSQAGLDNLTMSESKKDQLKAAFLLFCKRNFSQACSIVEEMFPHDDNSSGGGDSDFSLDRLVVSMSADLIDDFPASDPRWLKTVPVSESTGGIGSTMSLIILHQLEDKQTALEFYIGFLKEVGIWKRLTGVCVKDMMVATPTILAEHFEKTVATITLRTIHADFHGVVDEAIKQTLRHRPRSVIGHAGEELTPLDHFYREISRVEDVVNGFLLVSEMSAASSMPPREIVDTVKAVNEIILTVLKEVMKVRGQRKDEYSAAGSETRPAYEFLPWTATPGPQGIRTLLMRQFHLTLEKAGPLAEDSAQRADIYRQLVDLADFVLDGYAGQLESLARSADDRRRAVVKQYEKDRAGLVMPLVRNGCLEEAAALAEKYLEFNALVKICEITDDNARLEQYMRTFDEHNFSNYVFDWHVREGKQARLLKQNYSNQRSGQLGKYLKGHADISWIHDIEMQNYADACATLRDLAHNEVNRVSQKKTLTSLAKLCMLASDADAEAADLELRSVEYDLNLMTAQEQLPSSLLEFYGFDPANMRPLTAKELIESYVGDDNADSDHVDFKKSLDLLDYLAPVGGSPADLDAEREALKLRIWARSVLKDDWAALDTDRPIESIKETVFFRLVEFCYLQGFDLQENLPAPDRLLEAEELANLKSNANFQFLLRTGYEHVRRHCSNSSQLADESMM